MIASKRMSYRLTEEDLEKTAGGLVNLVLKNCLHVTGHEISRAKFTEGGITVNGRPARAKDRMLPGEVLAVVFPESPDPGARLVPTDGPLDILYEDEDLLVLNKPAGRVVHPSHGHYADSLLNDLAGHLERRGRLVIPRIVGRLDKDTSGVLLAATSQMTAARLFRQRERGELRREYLALVRGVPRPAEGVVEKPLAPIPGELQRQQVREDGRAALTHYRVLQKAPDEKASLVHFSIDTGRTHQIRVHMQSLGHPLLGDPLYGAGGEEGREGSADAGCAQAVRTMLHARTLHLRQPFGGEALSFTSPLPRDFCEAMAACGIPLAAEHW